MLIHPYTNQITMFYMNLLSNYVAGTCGYDRWPVLDPYWCYPGDSDGFEEYEREVLASGRKFKIPSRKHLPVQVVKVYPAEDPCLS